MIKILNSLKCCEEFACSVYNAHFRVTTWYKKGIFIAIRLAYAVCKNTTGSGKGGGLLQAVV